ncbi:hypothetical protein D3C80_1449110 [compost metagenome]
MAFATVLVSPLYSALAPTSTLQLFSLWSLVSLLRAALLSISVALTSSVPWALTFAPSVLRRLSALMVRLPFASILLVCAVLLLLLS